MTLRSTFLFFLLISGYCAFAQPVIQQIDKHKASLREVVSIKGSGFGTSFSDVEVWFGGAKATTIISVSDQLLTVEMPGNALYDQVVVVRTDTGLSGGSPSPFVYSFGGTQGIATTDFESPQIDFSTTSNGLNDLCACDFDGDGKTDIVASRSFSSSTSFEIFTNTGTPGDVDFTPSTLNLGARTRHTFCGDLNGDGYPDLIFTEDGTGVFLLKHNGGSVPNFAARQTINFPGREPKRIDIADVDRDGKPDLIITDQKVVPNTTPPTPSSVLVLRNTSTLTALSFAPAQVIAVPGAVSTDALDVADIDGDGFPEIVTSEFNRSPGNIFILKNTSSGGAISFNSPLAIPVVGNVVNVQVGDLDGDNKPDLAVSLLLSSGVNIYLNQSNSSTIAFSTNTSVVTDAGPTGIHFGDLDGDGRTDIAAASLRTLSNVPKSITVLSNISTVGNLNFERTTIPTKFINRNLRIGDMDNDGKPDIVFTSVDDNEASVPSSKISVLRNKSCLAPVLSPTGPLTICNGFTLKLQSTQGEDVIYQWHKNGILLTSETQSSLSVTTAGDYTVTIVGEGGTCSEISGVVNVSVITGTTIDPVVADNNGPVCIGDDLILSANAVTGATAYKWTGPEDFESGNTTPGQNVTVSDFSVAKAGVYELSVYIGTCLAQQTSTIVEAISIPEFSISAGSSTLFCENTTKTLTISPNVSNFTYKWLKDGNEISGATNMTFVINESGEYTAEITSSLNPGCQPDQTNSLQMLELTIPVAGFNSPTEACVGQEVEFENTSTPANPASPLFYSWTFGDANSSQDKNPEHSYSTATTRTVTLTVSYENGLCSDSESKTILITPAPSINITNAENRFSFCPEETIELGVSGGPFDSYEWTTNATTPTITIGQAGIVGVTVVTSTGCVLGTNRTIQQFDEPEVEATADPEEISRGNSTQLIATGLVDYLWSPVESLSDPAIPNPVASPVESTTYTVTGTDTNGCTGEATIEVHIKGESIVSLLTPANSFSPNGDGINETWIVDNILTFEECNIAIYDEKGVKVFESKPYLNSWDGTNNGKILPQGVYYYIIRCEGQEGDTKKGSITLLR